MLIYSPNLKHLFLPICSLMVPKPRRHRLHTLVNSKVQPPSPQTGSTAEVFLFSSFSSASVQRVKRRKQDWHVFHFSVLLSSCLTDACDTSSVQHQTRQGKNHPRLPFEKKKTENTVTNSSATSTLFNVTVKLTNLRVQDDTPNKMAKIPEVLQIIGEGGGATAVIRTA